MGRTACTEPQCLYSRAIPLIPLRAVRSVQSLSACTVELYLYSHYGPYGRYRASVPVQGCALPSLPFIWFSEETAIIFPNSMKRFFSCGGTAPLEPRPPHCWGFVTTARSVGLLWTRDRSVAKPSICQRTTLTRDISMPPAGFERVIPAVERQQITSSTARPSGSAHQLIGFGN